MRYLFAFVGPFTISLALIAGCGSDGGAGRPTDFTAAEAVTVSKTSPFAECTVEAIPDDEFITDSEVEPWIAVDPTNPDHIVAAWQQDRRRSGSSRGNVTSVSFDGGATWQESLLPKSTFCTDGPWRIGTDPWLAFAANGDLYSASLVVTPEDADAPRQAGILVHKSVDGGLTWGDPIAVAESPEDDKESIVADPFDECFVYLVWTRTVSGEGNVMFSRTTDCGETWSEPEVINTNNPAGHHAQIAILPDGALVAVFVENGLTLSPNEILVMRSTDRGATWSEEPFVAGILSYVRPVAPDSDKGVRAGELDIGVDRETGSLHLVWQQYIEGIAPVQIAYASSSDGGLTWSPPVRIDRTPGADSVEREQAFLPSVEVSADGTIGVTYYNFERDVPGDSRSDADVWFIHCHPEDGDCNERSAWSEPVRLTASSFNYQAAPLTSDQQYFLGDYVGLATAGSDFLTVLSVTTDSDPANAVFVRIVGQ